MTTATFGRYRLTLLATAALPIVPALLAAVVPTGIDPQFLIVITGVLSAVAVSIALAFLTRPFTRVTAYCETILADEPPAEPTDRTDELGQIARALRTVEARHQEAVTRYRSTLQETSTTLAKLGEGATIPEPQINTLCPTELQGLTTAARDAHKRFVVTRQRLAMATRVLQNLPFPLVAVDDRLSVRYVNTPFERLSGKATPSLVRQDLTNLLSTIDGWTDPLGRTILPIDAVGHWLKQGGSGEVILAIQRAKDHPIRVAATAVRLSADSEGMWYLALRDLTEETTRLAVDRSHTREQSLRAAWDSTILAGAEPVEGILAATRLLTAEAKQSAQRDALLPKVTAVRHQAGGLEAYLRTIRWLSLSFWGQLPEQTPSEFVAAEPVQAALDQLAPRLKARNINVTVSDKGGWICADEEWIRTVVLGIMTHACESTRDTTVGVHLKRLPATATEDDRVIVEIIDAGLPLSSAQRHDLTDPFGGLVPPTYLTGEASVGFLPGLILAQTLARSMGGITEFDTAPGGGLIVRMTLPSRVRGGFVAEPASEAFDGGLIEELCMGWRLGIA